MEAVYRNAIADHGATLISHIALVDETGTEITGGSPAYARQPVTWTIASDGTIRPDADLTFDIPAGVTVGCWRGYDAILLFRTMDDVPEGEELENSVEFQMNK